MREHDAKPNKSGKSVVQNPACIEFALTEVSDPAKVARFLIWLEDGKWPDDDSNEDLSEVSELTTEEATALLWGDESPRRRMANLAWELIRKSNPDHDLGTYFSLNLEELSVDCSNCESAFGPIRDRLKWVLEGVEKIDLNDAAVGQGRWGEEWFLPKEQTEFVRGQLAKIRVELLEKPSDYEEATEAFLDTFASSVAKFMGTPILDDDRTYNGEVRRVGFGDEMYVSVEARGERRGLPNAREPFRRAPGTDFGWGYGGHGPQALALSLLADATGGDIDMARGWSSRFVRDVVSKLPLWHPFQLTRADVISWLAGQGVGQHHLSEAAKELRLRQERFGPIMERNQELLKRIRDMGGLRAQRFDLVPADFESSLYVDLTEFLRHGKRIMKCNRCGLPISSDGSARSNRQRARWLASRPIYHAGCAQQTRTDRKGAAWQRLAQDPLFREKRRIEARQRRQGLRPRRRLQKGARAG